MACKVRSLCIENTTNTENFIKSLRKYRKLACIWREVLIDWAEIFHTSLNFAAVWGKKPPCHLDQ